MIQRFMIRWSSVKCKIIEIIVCVLVYIAYQITDN